MTGFITGFNGARDLYMLPLALHEAGLLEAHLTDFYAPHWLARAGIPRGSLFAIRNAAGLPVGKTRLVPAATFAFLRTRLTGSAPDFSAIDRYFSEEALRLHEKTGAHLFLHSGYAGQAFAALRDKDALKILFQYHPHPLSSYDILERDFALHPEVAWSFSNEEDTRIERDEQGEAAADLEWQLADRVYTASTFTKATLIARGCSADKIVVTPYGAEIAPNIRLSDKLAGDECHFLFVGQAVQRKGIHHLLKAWQAAGLSRSRLTIVARKIDPGLRALLEQPGVTVLPGVSSGELEQLYASADIFVMPSIVEGFGLVYLEALAHGLFCIGTANTGLPDLDPSGSVSTIVEPAAIGQLVNALIDGESKWAQGALNRSVIANSLADFTWQAHRRGITDDLQFWMVSR